MAEPERLSGKMNSSLRGQLCEVLRTISERRALSSDIPASQEGVYRPINCSKEKTFSGDNSTFAAKPSWLDYSILLHCR